MHTAHRIAVIGGGYAGLAAAVELVRNNMPVTVFEAARQLGGRARRVELHGRKLDNGQHILIGAYRETLRLMALVGVNLSRDLLRLPLEFDLPGQFHLKAAQLPAPFHLAWGLASATGLSWGERLSALCFMHRLRKQSFRLPQDMSVAHLLAQHTQREKIVRMLWEPLCIGALNTPIETASAQVFLHVLRDTLEGGRQASDMLLPRVDLSSLFPDPAATYVERHGGSVLKSMRIRAMEKTHRGYLLRTDVSQEEFGHVICAVSPSRLSALIGALPGMSGVARMADTFHYQPICTVYLQYPPHVRLPKPMIGFAGGLAQWAFDRGRLHRMDGLVAVVISARGRHTDIPSEQLAETIHHELTSAVGPLPLPEWHQVITEKRATFSCVNGLARPSPATPLPNLYLAGDYTGGDYPATLEGAMRSGVKCAKLIMENT